MDSLYYRPCVGIMLFNRRGLVFVGRRRNKKIPEHLRQGHEWQMPQGGIDVGEAAEVVERVDHSPEQVALTTEVRVLPLLRRALAEVVVLRRETEMRRKQKPQTLGRRPKACFSFTFLSPFSS